MPEGQLELAASQLEACLPTDPPVLFTDPAMERKPGPCSLAAPARASCRVSPSPTFLNASSFVPTREQAGSQTCWLLNHPGFV